MTTKVTKYKLGFASGGSLLLGDGDGSKPKPIQGRVFYDYAQGKMGIQYQGARGAFLKAKYLTRVALRKVSAIVYQRDQQPKDAPEGAYGTMGFLVGQVATEVNLNIKDVVLVRWDGYAFKAVGPKTGHEYTVTEMASCLIVTSGLMADTNSPIIFASGVK